METQNAICKNTNIDSQLQTFDHEKTRVETEEIKHIHVVTERSSLLRKNHQTALNLNKCNILETSVYK